MIASFTDGLAAGERRQEVADLVDRAAPRPVLGHAPRDREHLRTGGPIALAHGQRLQERRVIPRGRGRGRVGQPAVVLRPAPPRSAAARAAAATVG